MEYGGNTKVKELKTRTFPVIIRRGKGDRVIYFIDPEVKMSEPAPYLFILGTTPRGEADPPFFLMKLDSEKTLSEVEKIVENFPFP